MEEKKEPEKKPKPVKHTVLIKGREIPVRCNLAILEEIQAEFGNIMDFADGLDQWTDENTPKMPNMHAIAFALPRFVTEGILAYNEEPGHVDELKMLTTSEILRHCDESISRIAVILREEFWACMYAPKHTPPAETSQN